MAKAKPITGLDALAPTGKNARIIARERLDEFYNWGQYVDNPYHTHELHNLRIAAKRLRYTLEVFAEVLPEGCASIIDELTHIQDELGALHDSDVLIALLRICLGSQDSFATVEHLVASQEKALAPPQLVSYMLNPHDVPNSEERRGLEQFLQQQERLREQQYATFRQHWYQLQARDFRREVLALLDAR